MPLRAGTRLGPYEIVLPIGAGGMGEVYQAQDTRLGRKVAIKILPEHLAENPERKERFEREAKVISQLNHPYICTLHDIGAQDGIRFLVMELIEGETLAQRLEREALPLDRAIELATQIAEGLDKAHRAGIVHRDLKPGNIMLTKPGVKLLDFGLAKLVEAAPVSDASDVSDSPTVAKELTQDQTILGTLPYMAPEQLDARSSDARTDIFAFGSILYEMVTGRRAFSGVGQASLIAAIMEQDPPPISSLEPVSPPFLDAIVSTCLAKDPEERWQSAGDLAIQLNWLRSAGAAAAPAPTRTSRGSLGYVLAALSLGAMLVLGYRAFEPPPAAPVQRLSILPTEGTSFATLQPPVISPDGTQVAFIGRNEDGNSALWHRRLDSLDARLLPGTDDAASAFWSPDGRSIAFFAQGRLKRVDISGGPIQVLHDAGGARGGTWNGDDAIVFSPLLGDLLMISASGGESSSVTNVDEARERSHRWPQFLPDGRHFLYFVLTGEAHRGVHVGSLDSPETKLVLPINTNAIYASGHLLYVDRGVLTAQPFDLDRLELSGEPFPLADGVAYDPVVRRGLFSVSETGVVVYHRGEGYDLRQLTWYDRAGVELARVGEPGSMREPWLFRDARNLLVARLDPELGTYDVWLEDLERGVSSRLTFAESQDWFPVSSPDGREVLFSSSRSGTYDIYRKPVSGTGAAELVTQHDVNAFLNDWSWDGKVVVFQVPSTKGDWDIWTLPYEEGAPPTPTIATDFSEQQGRLSPDGRGLAYVSNETGRFEVYVQPFPPTGAKWQISSAGGFQPRWRGDGKELFYLRRDERLMAVPVDLGDDFTIGEPRVLFETRLDIAGNVVEYTRHYDVAPDGQRFLLATLVGNPGASPITILTSWPSLLRR